MIKIGILGDIGSGKSFVAKSFGYPIFDADAEVAKIYQKDKKIFRKLKKKLPKFFTSFPINKKDVTEAIMHNKTNLNKIVSIIHREIRKKLSKFLKKNEKQKVLILDIPLFLENRINKKDDVLIFVDAKKPEILKRLKKRKNFNKKLIDRFKKIQLPLDYKKRKSQFIIKNNFKPKTIRKYVKYILKETLQRKK